MAFVPQPPVVAGFGVGPTNIAQQLDGDSDITLQSDLLNPMNDLEQTGFHGAIMYNFSSTTASSTSAATAR